MKALTTAALLTAALCGCAGAPERQARTQEELFAERRATDDARGEAMKLLAAKVPNATI